LRQRLAHAACDAAASCRAARQRLAADADGVAGLGVVAEGEVPVPPDGDVPVPPAGGVLG
jgi:hypothetical protein